LFLWIFTCHRRRQKIRTDNIVEDVFGDRNETEWENTMQYQNGLSNVTQEAPPVSKEVVQ